ncbi:RNA-guided endonuclease InsQ/TnpB family protein [Dictyobacter aurantiacus]|uniref:Transposase n=1 Tax=Dictyobacter aurantiacus TaxID=1936993 RepID=A0A401ZQL3_9CHLR|nr:RNA-guided endonuclease TnpB family protein [Dictyobacter aurantiacus]GCE09157.1 transposase [Dictyobacter aurantiacus]
MRLVERHLVRTTDPRFAAIDAAAFASKNLYNQANYQIRQTYISHGKYLSYADVFHLVKGMDCYKALPAKVANSILILLHKNWVSFFEALEAFQTEPSRFTGRPRLPRYKDKAKGRNILIYDTQALGKRAFKKTGKLIPSGLPIEIETSVTEWWQLAQVRIVPRADGYMIEVVYEQQEEQADVDTKLVAALDPGVNVLAALTSNKPGFVPRLVSGKPLKSLNQQYNKRRAQHQSRLSHEKRFTSRHLDRVTTKRNRRVDSYLHTASRRIIDLLVEEGIGVLVIGKNPLWKQEVNLGSKNNQQFVQLPHARFIEQLAYKAQLVGIQVIIQEESYTSKASFLDNDPLPTYQANRSERPIFSGRRIARSWYRASDGTIIHADINGSWNILRKSNSDLLQLGRGVAGAAVRPRRLAV